MSPSLLAARAAGPLLALALLPATPQAAEQVAVDDRARAGAATASHAPAPEVVQVRTGRHPDFVRLVVEWSQPTTYELARAEDRVTVRFPRPAHFDSAAIERGLRPLVRAVQADEDTIELQLAEGAGLRHFRLEDGRVVLDILEPEPIVSGREEPAADAAEFAEAAIGEPAAVSPEIEPAELAEPEIEEAARDEPPGLTFAWAEPVAAAVFVRAGHLWAVFAAPQADALELPGPAAPHPDLGPPELLVAGDLATALRFPLLRPLAAEVAREGGSWRIRLVETAEPPAAAAVLRLNRPPRLRVPAAEGVVELVDPTVGDRLLVLPIAAPKQGQPQPRRLVDLEQLVTSQGLAWRARADDLEIAATAEGVEILRPGGLRLSMPPPGVARDQPDGAPDTVEIGERDAAEAAATIAVRVGPPLGLVDRDLDDGETVPARLRRLQRLAEASEPAERPFARLELARFLLAQGLAPEARAVLDNLEAGSEGAGALLPLRQARQALIGAADLLMGRHGEAGAALLDEALDDDPEVALWRAALLAPAEDWRPAAEALARSGDVLRRYPLRLQARLGEQAARIALADGDADAVYDLTDRLQGLPLWPEERAPLALVRALALARDGALAEARRLLADLAEGRHELTARQARYALVMLELDGGGATPEQAVAALAGETSFWRGHPQEAAMLDGLARLQADLGDSPEALWSWRRALTLQRDDAEAERIALAMRAHFADVLSRGGAEAPPPVAALALYGTYPELAPSGAEGERLLRHLARRLGAAGLVDTAGSLLEPLIRSRLRGPARAEAGAELALLRLEHDLPEGALAALAISRSDAPLAEELERRRLLLEARALATLGRHEDMLARLAGREDREARRLRLAAMWAKGDWPAVIAEAEALLAGLDTAELGTPEAGRVALRLALARAHRGEVEALAGLARRLAGRLGDDIFAHGFRALAAGLAQEQEPARLLAAAAKSEAALRAFLDRGR